MIRIHHRNHPMSPMQSVKVKTLSLGENGDVRIGFLYCMFKLIIVYLVTKDTHTHRKTYIYI